MKILTHKDLILGFLKQNLANKEHQKQIRQILDNENSVFILSKKFFTFIREELTEDYLHEYERIVTKLSDSGVSVKSSETSENFEDEILHIFSSLKDNVVVSISCDQPSQEIQNAIPNIAILSQQQKPNYHWLVVNLAILHPFTLSVDEIDFSNDAETDKFFDDLFFIPKNISTLTIFDDYYNVDRHNKYAKIANNKNIFVYYCTGNHQTKSDLNGKFNKDKFKILKKKFPKLELWTKNRGAHARRIVFEGFIVNPDIDLDLLNKTDNKMWSVHIRFTEVRANEIIRIKYKDYRKFISS